MYNKNQHTINRNAKQIFKHGIEQYNTNTELDFVAFYLDDGVMGGTDRAVRLFCETLRTDLAKIGLEMQFPKCEVVPTAGSQTQVRATDVAGFKWIPDGNFKLLGAPFGSAEFCMAHTVKRRTKLRRCPSEWAKWQTSSRRFSSCASA